MAYGKPGLNWGHILSAVNPTHWSGAAMGLLDKLGGVNGDNTTKPVGRNDGQAVSSRGAAPNSLATPEGTKAVQNFLRNRGYNLTVDGINGPQTKAAVADWLRGEGKRSPDAFNAATHNSSPSGGSGASAKAPANDGGAGPGLGGGPGVGAASTDPLSLLTSLLGKSDTASLLPTSLANDVAAPDAALAQALQTQLDQLPTAKAKALSQIADWFGQVQTGEETAQQRNKDMADAGATADQQAASAIASSLGGSAMGGSAMIGAMGTNDANTLRATGASDKMLSEDLAPIFASEKANALTGMSNKFDQGQTDLLGQLAQAQGKVSSDKAAALMQILGSNNAANKTNFDNKASLLQTLAGLQISGMNASSKSVLDALRAQLYGSQIAKNEAGLAAKTGPFGSLTQTQRQSLANNITKGLLDSSGKLSVADWPTALRNARNSVRTAGLDPTNPQVIKSIIGPALASAGITGPGGGPWPAIFQP